MMNRRTRHTKAMVALAAALTLVACVAEARIGGGRSSFGSRGSRTYEAPPATRTAPSQASPIERSQIPQTAPSYQRPGVAPSAPVTQPRRFGFGTGLMAGLFGAGLLGLLTGHGFFGGLAGVASVLGFILQVGLIVLLVSLAVRWFRSRQEPAYAGGSPAYRRSGLGGMVPPIGGGLGGASTTGGYQSARPSGVRDEVGITERDYAAFERALVELQSAYSRQDVAALWTLASPEMAGYMQEELNENARKGVVNQISDVRLLQGDLAEAWREGDTEYATLAMRYSLVDVTRDKATGRIVEGDPARPTEATEIWTFRRDRGGDWKLSAIQQS